MFNKYKTEEIEELTTNIVNM